jgi:hypothetical protein
MTPQQQLLLFTVSKMVGIVPANITMTDLGKSEKNTVPFSSEAEKMTGHNNRRSPAFLARRQPSGKQGCNNMD